MDWPNAEYLSVPNIGPGMPPQDGGIWDQLIADTFDERGALSYWTRRNPLYLSMLPPSTDPLPDRLSFDLTPELDLVAAHDREILVAPDAWNGDGLMVIPIAVARIDNEYITCILRSKTVDDLRRNPHAWRVAAERYDANQLDDQPRAASLPQATEFDPYAWFGDEGIAYVLPLARLRTAQTAPTVLDGLARADDSFGLDYEPAPWWAVDDEADVIQALESAGYVIRRDESLASRYSNY